MGKSAGSCKSFFVLKLDIGLGGGVMFHISALRTATGADISNQFQINNPLNVECLSLAAEH